MKVLILYLLLSINLVHIPVSECTNEVSLKSKKALASELEFDIEIKTNESFQITLFSYNEGNRTALKKQSGNGSGVISFTEKKLSQGHYRVLVEFSGDTPIICKRKSLDII